MIHWTAGGSLVTSVEEHRLAAASRWMRTSPARRQGAACRASPAEAHHLKPARVAAAGQVRPLAPQLPDSAATMSSTKPVAERAPGLQRLAQHRRVGRQRERDAHPARPDDVLPGVVGRVHALVDPAGNASRAMPSTSGDRLAGTRPPGSFSMLAARCSTFARVLAATSAAGVGSERSGSPAAADTAARTPAIRSAGSSRNTRGMRRTVRGLR